MVMDGAAQGRAVGPGAVTRAQAAPVLWLVVVALAHGLLYSALTPPWQGPDEVAHFEYAHLLAVHGRPLSPADASPALERALTESLLDHRAWDYVRRAPPDTAPARLADTGFYGPTRTLVRFSLAYVPYALAVRPFLTQPVVYQLYVMRLVSVVIGALVVALAFQTGRRLEPGSPALAYGAALFVLLLPQHAYLLGVVSDGHLAELLASVTLYLLVVLERLGYSWRRVLLAALAGAGALLSKTTGYFLVPLAALAATDWAWRAYRAGRKPAAKRRGRAGQTVVLAAVALGVVLLAPLALLPRVSAQPASMLAHLLAAGAAPGGFTPRIVALLVEGQLRPALLGNFMSFWATFGWMTAPLPGGWYVLLGAACLLSALGWGRLLRRRGKPGGPGAVPGGYALLALAAALSLAVIWGWMLLSTIGLGVYQGRYLFGAIVPIALLLVRGWLALAPVRQPRRALAVLIAGLVLLDAGALLLVMVPFFYG